MSSPSKPALRPERQFTGVSGPSRPKIPQKVSSRVCKKSLKIPVRVVKTVFLENGVFVPYRKQVVLTKNGENDDLHSTHKNKRSRSSEPGNRRK